MKKIIPVILSVLLIFSLVSITACRGGKESATEETSQKTATKETSKVPDAALIDINSATREELMALPGIGAAYTTGIIEGPAADAVGLTSDNPRGEDPLAILAEAHAGVLEVPGGAPRTSLEPDRARAIAAALAWAREGDAVVIAGKGHETTQAFADRTVPFDDREHALGALAASGWRAR